MSAPALALAEPPDPRGDEISTESPDAEQAIARFKLTPGFRASLYAAEPMLANPVAFAFDHQGRLFVIETFRLHEGVTDNRRHMDWLDDDLAARTVADRVRLYQRHLGPTFETYAKKDDRIRLILDRDKDGKADFARIFADGFSQAADGIGAGVLVRGDDVYFACIPDLYRLRDKDKDGRADLRESLHTGYGVHVAFLGHDLHGLIMGPDGRVYFSIGDRGLNVNTKDGTLAYPDCGAVLRCEPDGSRLEVVAHGLRNPQELAFDDVGNLFTGDNNSDSGDKARWVHILEGADSGWRMYYQYLVKPVARGPWNAEKLWHPAHVGQPAYIVPPIAHLGDGPSGLTHYPGTGFGAGFRGHFFLSDFRGAPALSGVRVFTNRPRGAGFELVDLKQFAWGILATDCDFGPDGRLYVSDWVQGWDKPGKGRIYAISPTAPDPKSAEVKRLLTEGMASRSLNDLSKLLGHDDQRVRLEAQFELAHRGLKQADVYETLVQSARTEPDRLTRVHAVWALGQIGRRDPKRLEPILPLLSDKDSEVRAQSAQVLGNARYPASSALRRLLDDPEPRVVLFGLLALSKIPDTQNVGAIVACIEKRSKDDPSLRHGAVMALASSADEKTLDQLISHPSAAVRLASVLVNRRRHRAQVAESLADRDPFIVAEAARAIYDEPIEGALPKLAALPLLTSLDTTTRRRILNANDRMGGSDAATRLAHALADEKLDVDLRIEAVALLGNWAKPSRRDQVLGAWRPIHERPPQDAIAVLSPRVEPLLDRGPGKLKEAVMVAIRKLSIERAAPKLARLAGSTKESANVRAEAIATLRSLGDPRLAEVVAVALEDSSGTVRSAAHEALAGLDPQQALPVFNAALEKGSTAEKQKVLRLLGDLPGEKASGVLERWMRRLLNGSTPASIRLDLLEAAAKKPALAPLVQEYANRPRAGRLADHRDLLEGGDEEAGRKIFFERTDVSCLRCHRIGDKGGEVGPELSAIAKKATREDLLDSIVDPNKQISQGFDTSILTMQDGQVLAGIVKEETPNRLILVDANAKRWTIAPGEIEQRTRGKSAMPDDVVQRLSRRELRDLVEFLSTLKGE